MKERVCFIRAIGANHNFDEWVHWAVKKPNGDYRTALMFGTLRKNDDGTFNSAAFGKQKITVVKVDEKERKTWLESRRSK